MAEEHYSERMQPVFTPQMEEAHHRTTRDIARAENGNGLADHRFCILAGTPEWEQWAMSLPVDRTFEQPIQNPDGSFLPMDGFDTAAQNNVPLSAFFLENPPQQVQTVDNEEGRLN